MLKINPEGAEEKFFLEHLKNSDKIEGEEAFVLFLNQQGYGPGHLMAVAVESYELTATIKYHRPGGFIELKLDEAEFNFFYNIRIYHENIIAYEISTNSLDTRRCLDFLKLMHTKKFKADDE